MRELNLLNEYPEQERIVHKGFRGIKNALIATEAGKEYFDGDRKNGYGGYVYDGRWVPIAKNLTKEYGLTKNSKVLEIGCAKGFLLHDLKKTVPGIKVTGADTSQYAIDNAMPDVKESIVNASCDQLPLPDHEFDLVIAIRTIYQLHLGGVVKSLREIQRVGKGKSFITVMACNNDEERTLFKEWNLLAGTILTPEEWREVFKFAGYTGDYYFTTVTSLRLVWDKSGKK